jgi:hypothetical protein
MAAVADDGDMSTFLLAVLPLAAVIAMGVLATRHGVDSRHSDPGELRRSWH